MSLFMLKPLLTTKWKIKWNDSQEGAELKLKQVQWMPAAPRSEESSQGLQRLRVKGRCELKGLDLAYRNGTLVIKYCRRKQNRERERKKKRTVDGPQWGVLQIVEYTAERKKEGNQDQSQNLGPEIFSLVRILMIEDSGINQAVDLMALEGN